jgi:hypothetical protein
MKPIKIPEPIPNEPKQYLGMCRYKYKEKVVVITGFYKDMHGEIQSASLVEGNIYYRIRCETKDGKDKIIKMIEIGEQYIKRVGWQLFG